MAKKTERAKIKPADKLRARELDARTAEILEHQRTAQQELLELPKIIYEFKIRKLWRALGYKGFMQWVQYRFRGSHVRAWELLKIGRFLDGISKPELLLLGKTRAVALARLSEHGIRVGLQTVERFRAMKAQECRDYVNRKLGLRGVGSIWFGGFHATYEASKEIVAGRKAARKLGFASVGDAERAAWRAFASINGAIQRLPKPELARQSVTVH